MWLPNSVPPDTPTSASHLDSVSMTIHPVDAGIVILYLFATVMLGVWLGRGQRKLDDYLLGGRNLPWWAILLSIVATETSVVTFLSVPGLAYTGDFRFLQLAFGYLLGRLLVIGLLLPLYFRGDLFTAYQVLHERFGGAVKRVASLLFIVMRNLADGFRLFLTALVLREVVGLELWQCVLSVGVATIIYTFLGGMRSVVWNDCIQFVVYMTGAVVAMAAILRGLPDGWSQFVEYGQVADKFRVFSVSLDFTEPYTLWAGLVGGAFLTMATHGVDQLMVQRYLCARTQRHASWALGLSGLVVVAQFALFLMVGVGLASFYAQWPEALTANGTEDVRSDEVFARFIVTQLPIGIVGLTLAAVFAAAMSTLSSSLNSSATAAVNDFYLPWKNISKEDHRSVTISRLFTLLFGVIQITVALAGQYFAREVIAHVLAIAGFTMGLILGLFLLAVFVPRASQLAALSGFIGGLIVITAVAFGTEIAWPWYTIIGSSTTLLTGALVHEIMKKESVKP
jgi:solute:Na+ symporter, SSS family